MDGFVEEVDFHELNFVEVVGRGAFGVVSRAKWRGIDVAVKLIETESEKKAFITELKQLSRVLHPNIVKLYGASTKHPVCLVMEYAEGGSLYNVLHGSGAQPDYTAAHAMSWALQCACGVAYLHGMKPKPLVHRDLKPPNLLLIAGGTILKICDFGTACDAHTHMTNNKGSAAWMAPEVFEGSTYSEKCDVFSWGIILWEVLTRRKPFDEIGGPAFRIMWAVHNGTRPPPIRNCPKPLEILMTRCWSSNPVERPCMAEVERIMRHLSMFFKGADKPLIYSKSEEQRDGLTASPSPVTGHSQSSAGQTIQDTMKHVGRGSPSGDRVLVSQPAPPPAKPVVVEEDPNSHRRTSAPASLAASRESLQGAGSQLGDIPYRNIATPPHSNSMADFTNKRYSAEISKQDEQDLMVQMNSGMSVTSSGSSPSRAPAMGRGHRRCGSYGSPIVTTPQPGNTWYNPPAAGRGHRRTGSYGNSPIVSASTPNLGANETQRITHISTAPDLGSLSSASHHTVAGYPVTGVTPQQIGTTNPAQRSTSWAPGMPPNTGINGNVTDNSWLNVNFITLDHQLQPLPPCPTCPDSVQIYEKHCQYAQEYLRVQTEIELLKRQEVQLQEMLREDKMKRQDAFKFIEEYSRLVNENEQLALLQKNMNKQLENINKSQQKQY